MATKKLGFWQVFGLIGQVSAMIAILAQDGKLSVRDGLKILESIAATMGVDIDRTGLQVPGEYPCGGIPKNGDKKP